MELEEYYGEEVIINKERKIVGLNEYEFATDGNSILLTTSIHDCIVVLIKFVNKVGMCHINISDRKLYDEGLYIIKEMIKNNEGGYNISIFHGPKTPMEECNELANGLNADAFPAYIDMYGAGGIAYDKEYDTVYGVDSDYKFYEYKFGAINKQKDPLEDYISGGQK